jgi:RimJ/RimL family protein N-acetyltransferase
MAPVELRTPRLWLRAWRDEDLPPFAALNADAEVMRHFPSTLTTAESDALAERLRRSLELHGHGLWAAEHQGAFIGFLGVARPRFEAHFTPCLELGWRLARRVHGQGLATEGAREVLRWARAALPDESLVSFTVPGNVASRRVMEKAGLVHDSTGDFDHPLLPDGHPLRRHVLYRLPDSR